MNYLILFLLYFFFSHFLYIGLGFLLYYVFKLHNIGHYLVCMGLAPMFGHPKKMHQWVSDNCPYCSCNDKCKRWTCPNYSKR